MKYRRLGSAGLKVSELSYGAWLTFGGELDVAAARRIMLAAFEAGVNFFDNAEAYANGQAEVVMGEALKELKRESLVISTKIFWGGSGPNDRGLSRKHVLEGTHKALKRLQTDYVDLLFCHRPDPETPIEETVRAMDHLIRQGKVLYWGTSEWSAEQLEEAYRLARELGCYAPSMEQPQYNLLHHKKVEQEYAPLYEKYGLGTTIWSPLASGLLSGKYNDGIPKGTRLDRVGWLRSILTPERLEAARGVTALAKELDCTPSQLSLAWCLKNPHVSTVILGASRLEQLEENLAAQGVVEKLDEGVMARLEALKALVPQEG
ncbi:MAG: potassium channel beta subunit family protein [Myxococcota bacterium]